MAQPDAFGEIDHLDADELRQRLHALQSLIARAPVPIAIAHDPECRFVSANRALASLLRLPADANFSLTPEPGDEPLYRIQQNGRDIPATDLPMQSAIAHRTPVRNQIDILLRDGTVLHVQNDVEPLYDAHGAIYGCISVCVDLTERQLAEDALREADRRKDEFLATLSHELRNPLAPMRTALEVMRLAHADPAVVEQARVTMERQLMHMVRITDDLLDVARITQNRVELRRERLDLRTVLQSAVEAIRPLIDAQGLKLTVQLPRLPIWMDADFTRLAQVFSNLLNNASKYTDRDGAVRLTVDVRGEFALVTVADTGVGIDPAMLPRVFDMFTQLQPHRDRTQGGLGIGLTIAKRLVMLHGGTIDARSDGPGLGSRFIVRLPVVPFVEERVPPGLTTAHQGSGPCRVLVAEDNPDAAEMMRVMLGIKGHEVSVAGDGVAAVELASTFDPHIAFLDIGMPRMDGYEAGRRIRALLGSRVVLVALTGWGQDEDKRRSREAGFDHHLTKPPEPEVLDEIISRCGTHRSNV